MELPSGNIIPEMNELKEITDYTRPAGPVVTSGEASLVGELIYLPQLPQKSQKPDT